MDFFKKEQLILHGVTGWMIGKLTGLIWGSTYAAVTIHCTGGACINANMIRGLGIFFIKRRTDTKSGRGRSGLFLIICKGRLEE